MQKKLIALAVAGLVSVPVVPAFAQSNVTIYGVVDYSLNYQRTGIGGSKRQALDATGDWNQYGSRIGFRGVEDLGNGLKASFVLEGGFEGDTGRSAQGGRLFGRQAFGALSGGFGTVAYGRQQTPQYNMIVKVDPFGLGTAGNAAAVYNIDWRLDNTIAYVSPDFAGFNVTAAYSFNADGQEVAKDKGNYRVWAINPVYSNGPIYLGLNYHQIKSDLKGADKTKVWDVGGTYDFQVVKIALLGGQRKRDDDAFDYRNWMVGATVPVTQAGKVMISFNHVKEKESGLKANQWALGYNHALSKRTELYTTFAKRGKDYQKGFVDANNVAVGTMYNIDAYEKQFQVGVAHKF